METAGNNKKRKDLTDFFSPQGKTIRLTSGNCKTKKQPITSAKELPVPGLTLWHNFITSEEERSILIFLNSDKCIWRTDLSRRTMHFGGDYCLMPPRDSKSEKRPQMFQAPDMPSEFNWLLDRMTNQGLYAVNKKPQYCIVNQYTGNLGISAHTENFTFAQPVVGLSLLNSCSMRFHELVIPDGGSVRSGKAQEAARTGKFIDVVLPGRSLLVMNDDARWKWQHEILRSKKGRWDEWERVSLTFRIKRRDVDRRSDISALP